MRYCLLAPERSCVALCMIVLLAGFLGSRTPLLAQENRLLPTGDVAYDAIGYLQRRGHLLELNPTSLPYRYGEVWDALGRIDTMALGPAGRHRLALLRQTVRPVDTKGDAIAVGYAFEAGARVINSDRLDVLRPLGDEPHIYWYGVPVRVYADAGSMVAALGIRQDRYYDEDPDGLDTALRLMARSEDTYVGFHSPLISVYAGRWSQHWSVHREAGVLLSDNARSQDQVSLRFGGRRLSVQSTLSELDSITDDGRFTGRVGDDTVRVGSRRRFLAAHRLDFRPSRSVVLSIMESVVYSGSNAGVSLKYLNPLHPALVVVDNSPKNDENNATVAAVLWAQIRRLTVHGQLLVDDLNVQRGKGNETITYSFAGSLVYALSSVDLGITIEAVTARAYNAPQPEGKYVYLRRGLGTQFSDYVHVAAFADLYLDHMIPGLLLRPRLDWLFQGERDIRDRFPENEEVLDNILDGVVARTMRPAVQLVYQPSPRWWVRLNGGVNVTRNEGHVTGHETSRFVGLVEVGLRLRLDRAFRLSFR